MKKKNSKQRFMNIAIVVILILGIGVLSYPFVSNWYNQRWQNELIEAYDTSVSKLSERDIQEELAKCYKYNEKLLGNVILTDPFNTEITKQSAKEYEARLNLEKNGIMGYLEIPKIDVKLNIGHGTSSEVLEWGVGHLENTSLPVGGKATHAVLSAHTAFPKATLFNNLVKLERGDLFYITVLNQKLVYKVENIIVVEPSNTKDLAIHGSEDYVTLVTCTPYGVNSHRLLVRGKRTDYVEEEVITSHPTWHRFIPYLEWAAVAVVFSILMRISIKKRRRRKANEEKSHQ